MCVHHTHNFINLTITRTRAISATLVFSNLYYYVKVISRQKFDGSERLKYKKKIYIIEIVMEKLRYFRMKNLRQF